MTTPTEILDILDLEGMQDITRLVDQLPSTHEGQDLRAYWSNHLQLIEKNRARASVAAHFNIPQLNVEFKERLLDYLLSPELSEISKSGG